MIHTVLCSVCRDEGQPHRWRESCEDCIEDRAAEHLRTTGHVVEITVTVDEPLRLDVRTARLTARRGW